MCANQVAEEERVIEAKLAKLDTDAACQTRVSVTDP